MQFFSIKENAVDHEDGSNDYTTKRIRGEINDADNSKNSRNDMWAL